MRTSLCSRFLQMWTTCSRGLHHMWIIIISHGFYGNNMVFSIIHVNPRDTLQLVESESTLWNEAHAALKQTATQPREEELSILPQISGRLCFTNSSWKIRIITRDKIGITHYTNFCPFNPS